MDYSLLRVAKRNIVAHPLTLPVLLLLFAFAGDAMRYALGWVGFFLAAGLLVALSVKKYWSFKSLHSIPGALVAFILWSAISALWSHYLPVTIAASVIQVATASVGLFLASRLTWTQIATSLDWAFRIVLGLSLLLEAYAAIIVKGPISAWVNAVPGYYWVQGNLLNGLPIQGITGNRNLLAFVALLFIITISVRYASKQVKPLTALAWVVGAAAAIVLCDSATVYVAALAVTILVFLVFILRKIRNSWHKYAYYGLGGLSLLGLSAAAIYSTALYSALGRDSELSGRTDIWNKVRLLAEQHPITGWGWTSYWAPWVKPYKNLAVIDGTTYLQAHNAALDVWLQLGVVGLIFAAAAVVLVAIRTWRLSVSPTKVFVNHAEALLPVLLIAALLVQSITESRLLIEGNWLLFVLIACKAKLDAPPYGSMRPTLHEARRFFFTVGQGTVDVWEDRYQKAVKRLSGQEKPLVESEVVLASSLAQNAAERG